MKQRRTTLRGDTKGMTETITSVGGRSSRGSPNYKYISVPPQTFVLLHLRGDHYVEKSAYFCTSGVAVRAQVSIWWAFFVLSACLNTIEVISITATLLLSLMYAMLYILLFRIQPFRTNESTSSPFRRRQPVVESPPLEDRPGNPAAAFGSHFGRGLKISPAARQNKERVHVVGQRQTTLIIGAR